MSRCPGKIERAIEGVWAAEPDNAFTTDDICRRIYRANRTERKHRVAVLRALRRACARSGEWEIWHAETLGTTVICVNPFNVGSYAMARLKCRHYQSNDMRLPRWWRETSETDLREKLAPGGREYDLVREGGAWWRHVESYKAERDGDQARAKEINLKNQLEMVALLKGIR